MTHVFSSTSVGTGRAAISASLTSSKARSSDVPCAVGAAAGAAVNDAGAGRAIENAVPK